MNDYDTLIAFVEANAPAGAVKGARTPASYRDFDDYLDDKLTDPDNDTDDVKEMRDRALTVCGLAAADAATPTTLATDHAKAVAATVLAMSVIRDADEDQLEKHRLRLESEPLSRVVAELRTILVKGDVVQSKAHSHLELKNFRSAGTASKRYQSEAEEAYARTHLLLMHARQTFVLNQGALTGKLATGFAAYFGAPSTAIDTTTLPLRADRAPAFAAQNQSARAVVREVLRRVCDAFLQQKVRVYFGGRGIDTGTLAYVAGARNPTKVHLGGSFFGKKKLGINSQAGTVVHEFTHTFAGTKDHAYDPAPCRALAAGVPADRLKALTNADNYQYFVETVWG